MVDAYFGAQMTGAVLDIQLDAKAPAFMLTMTSEDDDHRS
jgi:hypothetical protein